MKRNTTIRNNRHHSTSSKRWRTSLCVLISGSLLAGIATANTLDWQGLSWHIAEGPGVGENNFSATTNCVWVDESGYLHLKTAYFSNTWYCAEVFTDDHFEYGEFRFVVDTIIPNLDTNIVGGLFLYNPIAYMETLGRPEIDIEFARQFLGMNSTDNTQYGLQPTINGSEQLIPTNVLAFASPADAVTTHRFVWTNDQIYFNSYTGDGAPGTGTQIAEYTRASNSVSGIPEQRMRMRLYLNNWLFRNNAPTDTDYTELVIRSIVTPPIIPEQPTATNQLDSFERVEYITVDPVTNMLMDFEQGVNGWGVSWNPGVIEDINAGINCHSGTNAMNIHKKYNPAPTTRNWSTNGSVSVADWTPYDSLAFWARTETAGNGIDTLKVNVFSSLTAAKALYQNTASTLSSSWQKFEYDLTGDYTVDGINMTAVEALQIQTEHNSLNSTNIFIDDIHLIQSETTITNYLWDLGSWNSYGSLSRTSSDLLPGETNALHYHMNNHHDPANPNTYNCTWTTNHTIRDWTEYNKISFWARRSQTADSSNHWIKIQFIQGDGNFWEQHTPATLTTNWTQYTVDLDILPTGLIYGGANWDGTNSPAWHTQPFVRVDPAFQNGMNDIYGLRFIFCNTFTNAVDYFVDNIELIYEMGDAVLEVGVSETELGFGSLAPSRAVHRFATTNYTLVNYTAENVYNWQIFVYSDNDDRRPGLTGDRVTDADPLPLKAWIGTNTPPDVVDTNIWRNLYTVPDAYADKWPIASSAMGSDIASGFRLYFATEVICAHTQDYSAPIIVELQAE